MADEATATLKTLELLEDGQTLVCDDHRHECRILWLAVRAVLVQLQDERGRGDQLETQLRECQAGFLIEMEKKANIFTSHLTCP